MQQLDHLDDLATLGLRFWGQLLLCGTVIRYIELCKQGQTPNPALDFPVILLNAPTPFVGFRLDASRSRLRNTCN